MSDHRVDREKDDGDGEANGPLAAALARGVCRTLRALGGEALTEFTLRTGRRVDVIAVGDDGRRQAVIRTVHGRGFEFVADVAPA